MKVGTRASMATAIVVLAGVLSCTSPLFTSSQDVKPMKPDERVAPEKSRESLANDSAEDPRDNFGRYDPRWQTYKTSTFASRPIKWDVNHKLDVCAGALGKAAVGSPSAVLFPGAGDEIVVENSVEEVYHVHALTPDGSNDSVHKVNGKRDLKQTVIQMQPPARLVIVTQAYRNTNPEVETLIPPSLIVVDLMPRADAQAVLSSQRFAYEVNGRNPLWVVPAPNTSVNHMVSMISLAGQDVSQLRLAQNETSFNALFRVAVRDRGKGTVHQKACLYPFRADTTPDQAGSPILRVVDPQEKMSAKIPASPRPKVWTSGRQARTEADVFASFYGLVSDARYKFIDFYGYAEEASVRYEPEVASIDGSRKTHGRHIKMPTQDPVVVVVGHQLAAVWEPRSAQARHNVIKWESDPRAVRAISVLDSPFDWISFLGAEDQLPEAGMGWLAAPSLRKMAGLGPLTSLIYDPSADPNNAGANSGALSGQGQGQGQGQVAGGGKGQGSATANPTINFNPNISLNCACGGGKGDLGRNNPGGLPGGYIPTPGGWSYPTPESPVPYGPYGPAHAPNLPPYQYPGTGGRSIP